MKIVYNHPETGQAVIVYPSYKMMAEQKLSIDHVAAMVVPNGTPFMKARACDLPKDNEFRGAWRLRDGMIDHCLETCREIKKERLRRERETLLAAEDVKFMRAIERGEDTGEIVKEKQRLRDVTKLVDLAETLDEIRAVTA